MRQNDEAPYGLLYEWDHIRLMVSGEWEYWQEHVLPFGWMIVTPPFSEADAGRDTRAIRQCRRDGIYKEGA